MGALADEVQLVRFNSEVVRVPYSRPDVEYQVYKDKPRVVDLRNEMPMMQVDIHRAKIHIFRTYRASNEPFKTPDYIEDRIALDQQSQNIVDMFVKSKERELMQIIDNYKTALNLEKTKTCHDRFVDWVEKRTWVQYIGRLFNG